MNKLFLNNSALIQIMFLMNVMNHHANAFIGSALSIHHTPIQSSKSLRDLLYTRKKQLINKTWIFLSLSFYFWNVHQQTERFKDSMQRCSYQFLITFFFVDVILSPYHILHRYAYKVHMLAEQLLHNSTIPPMNIVHRSFIFCWFPLLFVQCNSSFTFDLWFLNLSHFLDLWMFIVHFLGQKHPQFFYPFLDDHL